MGLLNGCDSFFSSKVPFLYIYIYIDYTTRRVEFERIGLVIKLARTFDPITY